MSREVSIQVFLALLEEIMLILASQSKYRKKLMRDFGLRFKAMKPDLDEAQIKKEWFQAWRLKNKNQKLKLSDYKKLAVHLAQKKALSVSIQTAQNPTFVIGSDQIAVLGSEQLSKPGTLQKAQKQLLKMRGKTHSLVTAVCVVCYKNKKTTFQQAVVTATIKMKKFTTAEMKWTLLKDHPIDCAGSYKLEKSGLRLIESLKVADFTAIVGLPMIQTARLLSLLGYSDLPSPSKSQKSRKAEAN